ncbi:MAG: FkbM family methyltransferase [Gammaproteobacteria bacterium]|nr:FkbM family methyltransferase [Gammaproteobacteria bacterium]
MPLSRVADNVVHLSSAVRQVWTHPANRGLRSRAILRYFAWQAWKRVVGGPVDVSYHGLRLRCYADSHSASAALYFSGLPEYREMSFVVQYLRPGDRFLDVGANIGIYTLLATTRVGAAGYVHAFEPAYVPLQRLRENVALNNLNNVSVHAAAVAESNGNREFGFSGDDSTGRIRGAADRSIGGAEVTTVRLDDYFENENFTMAKFDIEGAEPLALRGAAKMLSKGNPPVIQVEMDGYCKRYGITTPEFISELSDFGYSVGIYCPSRCAVSYTNEPWKHTAVNVLAVADSYRSKLAARLCAGDMI